MALSDGEQEMNVHICVIQRVLDPQPSQVITTCVYYITAPWWADNVSGVNNSGFPAFFDKRGINPTATYEIPPHASPNKTNTGS